MSEVRFIDTTVRDGSQSLWAMNMRIGAMAAIAGELGREIAVPAEVAQIMRLR